jgi:hypothetical protein
MTKIALILFALFVIGALIMWSRRGSDKPAVGGIYSTTDGKGSYSIVKVLAHGDGVTHIRLYKQKYQSRPATVDVAALSLGKIDEPGGFGIGHLPIRDETFRQWQPVRITTSAVTADELKGYKAWKEAGGAVF